MTLSILLEKYSPQKIKSIVKFFVLSNVKVSYEILTPENNQGISEIEIPQIRFIETDSAYTTASKIDKLLSEASKEYVIFLSDETFMTPNTIKDIYLMIETYPDVGIYVTDLQYKLDNGERFYFAYSWLDSLGQITPSDFSLALRKQLILEPYPAIVFNKKKAIEAGGIEITLNEIGFWFMILVTGFRYGVCYNPSLSFVKHSVMPSTIKADVNTIMELLELMKTKYNDLKGLLASSTLMRHFSKEIKEAYEKGCLPIDIDSFFLALVPLAKEGLAQDFLNSLLEPKGALG